MTERFNIHKWQREMSEKNKTVKLFEGKKTISIGNEQINFTIGFYSDSSDNFYYQFIPENPHEIQKLGEDKVTSELNKLIENKTSLVAPYSNDAPGAGFSFKVLPSELKNYLLEPILKS